MTRDDVLPCAPPGRRSALKVVVAAFPSLLSASAAAAASSAAIDEQADSALGALYASSDNAEALAARAQAVLVFARVGNAGFALGGSQDGAGVMRIDGASAAYYRIVGAPSAGANGAHPFSLAFFFVPPSALSCLDRTGGWDFGARPSLGVTHTGLGRILNTTTLAEDVYAVPFGQRGLMAGLGLEGSRIFRIHPAA
jgi:lipid-binding SYLF domain-containing protein